MPTTRRLDIGRAFSLAFRSFFSRIHWIVGVALVFNAPVLVVAVLHPRAQYAMDPEYDPAQFDAVTLRAAEFIEHYPTLAGLILSGLLSYIVVQFLTSQPVRLATLVSITIRKFFPMIGVGILSWILILLPLLIPFVIAYLTAGSLDETWDGLTGLIWVIIPAGLISAWAALSVTAAFPVIATETSNPIRAIARSFALTRGSKLRILVVSIAVGFIAGFIAGMGGVVLGILEAPFVAAVAAQTFLMLPISLVPGVVYCLLRRQKEGATSEDLVAVFQ